MRAPRTDFSKMTADEIVAHKKVVNKRKSDKYRAFRKEEIAARRKGNRAGEEKKRIEKHGMHPMNVAGTDAYIKYRTSEKYRRTSANAHLRRTYGITYDAYLEMLAKQGGVCKICGKAMARTRKTGVLRLPLFVDHNHKTGRVRGLLCSPCNTGVGMFQESEELMNKAIAYLKEN